MSAAINLLPAPSHQTAFTWGFVGALACLGVTAGTFSLLFGRGAKELVTAPRYRPTFPIAREVSPVLREARLAPRQTPEPVRAAPATAAMSVSAGMPRPSEPIAETHERGNWLRIPALSMNVPLAVAPSMSDEDVLRSLQVGVVRYPNGVEPGQPGLVFVAGHSTGEPWKGRYRFAFLNARKLQPGDVIIVDHKGVRYSYRITGQRVINPRVTPSVESGGPTPRLALLTCWPLWTTSQRLLVDAELASTARLVFRTGPPAQS